VDPRCPFCAPDPGRLLRQGALTTSLRDAYPLTDGHSLVTPARHVASLFGLSAEEREAVWEEVGRVRADLMRELGVDAFNIGLNDGVAAGQTVLHAHVHVIPRRAGDVPDPRGGVRWVVPARAAWWVPS
jgi:diadenosine tetraphosphate (Ap4A) HIT family hydrolase